MFSLFCPCRCKADLYRYMEQNMQLFLPQQGKCTIHFMQQILRDEKLVLDRQFIPNLVIPNWTELGVKTIWPQACKLDTFLRYMPDGWAGTDKIERKFFFGVLTSIAPMFIQTVINQARQMRYDHKLDRQMPTNQMQISEKWADMLLSQPFYSGKFISWYTSFICFFSWWKNKQIAVGSNRSNICQIKPTATTTIHHYHQYRRFCIIKWG